MSPARLWAAYGTGLAVALPLYLFFATERFGLLARGLAWLGLALGLLPAMVLLTRPKARPCAVAALGLWLTLFYHLAVFHERSLLLRWGEARISEASVDLALLLAALATPALWLGWAAGGALGLARGLPHPRLDVPAGPLRLCGAGIVLLSMLTDVLWLRRELTLYQPAVSVISVLTPADLGFAMVLMPTLRRPGAARDAAGDRAGDRDGERLGQALFWGLFAAAAALALVRGMLTPLVKPLLIYLLGWLLVGRRVRLWPVVVALGAVLLLQPVKAEFRARVWDRETSLGLADRAGLYVDLVAQHWFGGDTDRSVDKGESVQVAAARTGAALQLAHAVELTPSAVPHQWGATYRYLRFALMPRVFDPDKPIAQYADVWAAVVYGYTTPRGTAHVMVGLSQVAEAYINFGLVGGLLLLAGIGVLLRVMDEIFSHKDAGVGALCLHLYFVQSVTITLEGSLAQFWGGVLQSFLLYGVGMALLGALARGRGAGGRALVPAGARAQG